MSREPTGIEWDEAAFEAALKRAKEGIMDAHGVRLSADRLRRLLDAAPEDHERPGRRRIRAADFRRASFGGDARFDGASFGGDARFDGASFGGYASFGRARFGGNANFFGASFGGYARFGGARFDEDARFSRASFGGDARFSGASFGEYASFSDASFGGEATFDTASFGGYAFFGASFGGDARFSGARFGGNASFDGASFGGNASFFGASFGGNAGFSDASFGGDARFDGASFGGNAGFSEASFGEDAGFFEAGFGGDASFHQATFEQAREFGPLVVCGSAFLDRAVFAEPIRIELSARIVSCARAVFRGGADVFVRWADVSLEDADFAEPSLVAELPATPSPKRAPSYLGWEEPLDNGGWACPLCWEEQVDGGGWVRRPVTAPVAGAAWRCRPGDPPEGFEPRVVSLRRAKVAELTLSGVDLRACRFVGAHGLDRLRLERARFAAPPAGWHTTPVGWRGRWMRRRIVAEEHLWRRRRADRFGLVDPLHGDRWYEDDVRAPDWLAQASEPPEPDQIAGIYRALRKGREDSKDEPGAADFYYGEMEMRRHSGGRHSTQDPPGSRPVVSIIWLYWLVSGYGLRAGRALLALAISIVFGAVLFALVGFQDDKRPEAGIVVFALESSISLLRQPDTENLTVVGHIIQIVLRIAGPLFFGLALFALRGRVKR